MEKPAKLKSLPGQTLRRDLRKGAVPPLATFVRSGFRMSIAGGLYLYGLHHAALIVGIMAAMMLVGSVEGQAAKAVAKAIPRGRQYFAKHFKLSHVIVRKKDGQ